MAFIHAQLERFYRVGNITSKFNAPQFVYICVRMCMYCICILHYRNEDTLHNDNKKGSKNRFNVIMSHIIKLKRIYKEYDILLTYI